MTAGFGGAGTVDASTGIEVRDGTGVEVGAAACAGIGGGVGAFGTSAGGLVATFAGTNSDAAPGDGVGAFACTSTGDVVAAIAGTDSGDAAGDGVGAFACTSIGGVIAVFADTDSGVAA